MKNEFKDIEIGKRNWRIKKFDAMTGSYMLFKVIGIISPLMKGLNIKELMKKESDKLPDINFTEMLSGLTTLTEKDFREIQTKCLQICYEILPGGETVVLNKEGTYEAIDIEHDTSTVLALTVHALIYNVQGFFGESLFGFLPGALKNLKP